MTTAKQLDTDIVRVFDAFTPAECDKIVDLFGPAEKAPCWVYQVRDGKAVHYEDKMSRDVDVAALRGQPEYAWLHRRMGDLFASVAHMIPGHDAQRVVEPIKILRYGAGKHFRMWHSDKGPVDAGDPHWRELTMSVELSHPDSYDGGSLLFLPQIETNYQKTPRGAATIFNSRKQHAAKTVKQGTRWVLMNWISSKPLPCDSYYEITKQLEVA